MSNLLLVNMEELSCLDAWFFLREIGAGNTSPCVIDCMFSIPILDLNIYYAIQLFKLFIFSFFEQDYGFQI